MNRKDLCALTLAGPGPRENPVLDLLAVLHLDIRLYIHSSRTAKLHIMLHLKESCKSLHLAICMGEFHFEIGGLDFHESTK